MTSQKLLIAAETSDVISYPKNSDKLRTSDENNLNAHVKKGENYEWNIRWRNVFVFFYLHLTMVYGFYLLIVGRVKLITILWNLVIAILAALGVTAGAHRLWAHRSYKAKWQLRVILAVFQAMAFQNHIYEWVRDHRVHHKFTDTNADPHNAKRGFFFSHIGWLMLRKHPDVKIKGKTVDLSDLEKDWVVTWQRKTYAVLMPLTCFILPTFVSTYFWKENRWYAWCITVFRYTLGVNITWLVNSAAHIWGMKPFDKHISSTENKTVGVLALGEGWHNYHHVFPSDYKAAELGNYNINLTTSFIDFFTKIGWAYDLKTVSPDMIRRRALRTGDGSLRDPQDFRHHMNVWVWGGSGASPEAQQGEGGAQ